jgi:hypothetical protein
MTFTGTCTAINAALTGARFVPTPGFSGPATVQITSFDQIGPGGGQTDTDVLTITVTAVNDTPAAADDAFVVTGTTFTVPAPGVLANDTDPDSTGLTAQLVTAPLHGTLRLQTDGSFTCAPGPGYPGSDRFSYRASDGVTASGSATVTLTGAASACLPRPSIRPQPGPDGARLVVRVEATPLNGPVNNQIRELRFGQLRNARVTVNGQGVASGQTVSPATSAPVLDFTVERVTPGQPTTVPFTVVDACGEWQTFVGGGTQAGF